MHLGRFGHARIYPLAGFLHAEKDGGPVRRGEASWRTVSGVYLNTRRAGFIFFEFRRVAFR